MPTWTSNPPDDPRGYALPLMRTPANGKLCLHVTSPDMIGCNTHWFGGRTLPCEDPNCVACKEGVPWRWHAYLSGLIQGTRRHVLVEFTAQAAEIISAYRKAHATLRGCILTTTRHRNRHNGRVLVHATPGSLQNMNLPDAPDLIKAMSIIWNLPSSQMSEQPTERDCPRVSTPGGNHRNQLLPTTPPTD